MKRAALSLIISVFFTVLFIHVINNVSPWNTAQLDLALRRYEITTGAGFDNFISESLEFGLIWSLLNIQNVIIMLVVMGFAVISGVAAIHLFADKMFVRKFYEEPSLFNAFRRGVLIYSVIVGLVLLRFINGLEWYNIVAVITLAAAIEYGFISSFGKRKSDEPQVQNGK